MTEEQRRWLLIHLNNNRGGGTNSGGDVIPPTSSNLIVQNWIDKITLDGYEYPSQAKVDIYTTAFDYGDAQGLTTEIDLLGFLKVENQNLCKIPFIHSGGSSVRFLLISSPVFTANKGIKAGASGYIRTQWTEDTDGVKFVLGNGSQGIYTDSLVNQNAYIYGNVADNSECGIQPKVLSGVAVCSTQNGDFSTYPSASVATPLGYTSGSIKSGTMKLYKNGVEIDSQVSGSNELSPYEDYALTENAGGGPDFRYSEDLQFFYKGSGDIDQSKMNTFINLLLL